MRREGVSVEGRGTTGGEGGVSVEGSGVLMLCSYRLRCLLIVLSNWKRIPSRL